MFLSKRSNPGKPLHLKILMPNTKHNSVISTSHRNVYRLNAIHLPGPIFIDPGVINIDIRTVCSEFSYDVNGNGKMYRLWQSKSVPPLSLAPTRFISHHAVISTAREKSQKSPSAAGRKLNPPIQPDNPSQTIRHRELPGIADRRFLPPFRNTTFSLRLDPDG
jgi:hypothetical protein